MTTFSKTLLPGDVAARLWLERVVNAVDIDPNKTWTDIERMDHE